jgi:uncharacterized protein with ParB-like and HNH nuclease domain
MAEQFKPQSLTIDGIFNNTDSLYRIPEYQRPYRWNDEQIERLWDDIFNAFESKDENYFLGSIITAFNSETKYFDIVDGQQRLTTLMILFCVIRDTLNEQSDDIYDVEYVPPSRIKSSIKRDGRIPRLTLTTHINNQSDFYDLIINGDTSKIEKVPDKLIKIEDQPKYKFLNTANFFNTKLKDLETEIIQKLVNYIFNKIYLIRIDCTNRDFAMKLFQVLNDRGLDLSTADLFKSSLFLKLHGEYKNLNEEERNEISGEIKQCENRLITDWRFTEDKLKNTDISINDALTLYAYYLLSTNPKQAINSELEILFKEENKNIKNNKFYEKYSKMKANEIAADFKNFVEIYCDNIEQSENNVLWSLFYLRWNYHWKSILITAKKMMYPEFDQLVLSLRRLYYLHWIAGKTLDSIKYISFEIINWIKEGQTIQFINEKINKKLNDDDNNKNIIKPAIDYIISKNVYEAPWFKPLLILIEYNSCDSNYFIEKDTNLHIEHVLPANYEKSKNWHDINTDFAKEYIDSIGNLTLLSGSKNIQASDNSFDFKIGIYTGKGLYEGQKGENKITSFEITRKIVDDFNINKYNGIWNENAIIDRWNWFLDEFKKIFEIDLSEYKK